MTHRGIAVTFACLLLLIPAVATAQVQDQEQGKLKADFVREWEELKRSCPKLSFRAVGGCLYGVTTHNPLHLSMGNLAPQNGFAWGAALTERYVPKTENAAWRHAFSADAVAAASGSWRTGVSMKAVHVPATSGVTVAPSGTATSGRRPLPRQVWVLDVFYQSISLKSVSFFGIGPDTTPAGRAMFAERQDQVGTSLHYPVARLLRLPALGPTFVASAVVRSVRIGSGESDDFPPMENVYPEIVGPFLDQRRSFLDLREGIRIKPAIGIDRLSLNYLFLAQQVRGAKAAGSFNRWTLDLQHDIPLFGEVSSTGPRVFNTPNECSQDDKGGPCPKPTWSRNRRGTATVRLLLSTSSNTESDQVPFFFQQTLGGSDINGEALLASFDDYRFRGPHLIAFQEQLEHSVWGPLGAYLSLEQGKVATRRGDLDLKNLRTSVTVGVTIRAGGFPLINLSYSWGSERNHLIATISPTLLGGSARPTLY